MKKKLLRLSFWTFILALAIFVWTFFLFHYVTPEGTFSSVWQAEAQKPLVTLLFGIWGVMFLFSSVMSLLVAGIFYPGKGPNDISG